MLERFIGFVRFGIFKGILAATCLCSAVGTFAQDLECSSDVSLNGATIEVVPVAGDDSANIQCALQSAADLKYRDVYLKGDSFTVSQVSVNGFFGRFRGQTPQLGGTQVIVEDGSLACSDGSSNPVFLFEGGEPTVFRMDFRVGSPCNDGSVTAVLAFYSNPNDCNANRLTGRFFGSSIIGLGASAIDTVTGVLIDTAPQCDVNEQKVRSEFSIRSIKPFEALDFGVIVSSAGGLPVIINTSDFREVGLPISIIDSNQTSLIQNNVINFNDQTPYGVDSSLGTTGIALLSSGVAPDQTTTIIKDNVMNDGGASEQGIAIASAQFEKNIDNQLVVIGNTFRGDAGSNDGLAISTVDSSGVVVTRNTFIGPGGNRIEVVSGSPELSYPGEIVSGWGITNNEFRDVTGAGAPTDIFFGENTSGNVVGAGQGEPCVIDQSGGANDILEEGPCPDSSASASSVLGGNGSSVNFVYQKYPEGNAQPRRLGR